MLYILVLQVERRVLDPDDLRSHIEHPKEVGAGSGKGGQVTIRDVLPGKLRVILGRINNGSVWHTRKVVSSVIYSQVSQECTE